MITVLFVDDEPALLDVSRIFLEKSGELKVDTCDSATEALELLKDRSYDAIVSDYEMPCINGIEFLKRLRTIGDPTPFIIFTGKGREHVVIEALNSGADFYLQKGGDPRSQFTELIHKIKQAVQRRKAEISLLITQSSVDHASDCIFWIDRAGRITYANEAAAASLGYTREEILLLTVCDIDTRCDRNEWKKLFHHLKCDCSCRFESVFRKKDGSYLPVEVGCVYHEFQQKPLIFSYCRDISDRKNDEGVLKASEQRYRELADSLPQIVLEMSASGMITFANTAAISISGYTPDDLESGLNGLSLISPEYRERATKVFSRVLSGQEITGEQIEIIRKDGTFLQVRIFASPIFQSDKKETAGVRALVIAGSTSHGQGNETIREDDSPHSTGTLIMNTYIRGCDSEFCRILGSKKARVINHSVKKISPVFQPDMHHSGDTFPDRLEQASEENTEFPWRWKKNDRSCIDTMVAVKKLFTESGHVYVLKVRPV
jgi:PAS domain S-box-containing protein